MTNASLGLRLTHVYHNCFYTTFTAPIPSTVNIGFGGEMRQAALSSVNQQNQFDHNPRVSARNEFADNSCTAYPHVGRACFALPRRPPRATGLRLAGSCRSRHDDMPPLAYARKRGRQMQCREITRLVWLPPPLLRNSSFAGPANPDIRWFRVPSPNSSPPRRTSTPRRPVDTSKRRIHDGGRWPADEAARSPALSLRVAERIMYEHVVRAS
jgi:hypothetical protein